MRGRAFLGAARAAAGGPDEPHWRSAVVGAYYALLLECRDALMRWGRTPPPKHNVHAHVRLEFTYARDAELQQIGRALDVLVRMRNKAHYDLAPSPAFNSPADARAAIVRSEDNIARLDAIEADPARLAAAVASLPPVP